MEAGAIFCCTQRPSALASRLAVSGTDDASIVISLLSPDVSLSTFLPSLP
jgi:hypothetical protein